MHISRAIAHFNSPLLDEIHHDLLAQIASMYYEQELSQSEIGERLGLSRVKVYRLLKEAREAQVVQVIINWPVERDSRLEKMLCQTFGLQNALVMKSSPQDMARSSDETALQRLGAMAARYLEGMLEDEMTLAVCLGRSTYEVINAVRPGTHARVNVAQAMGSIPYAIPELDSAVLARQLAYKLGGQVLLLSSPLMANSPEAAQVLRSQPGIERTLQAAKKADIILLGIGGTDPETSHYVRAELISAQQLRQLEADGAVGDAGGQFVRLSGELHPCDINQRMIGLTLDELRRIPNAMAAAMGPDKVKAILGTLRSGVLNVLCTDDLTAVELARMGCDG
jgi:DNA-binding transcriptional regulator LsrR (DeoR family)